MYIKFLNILAILFVSLSLAFAGGFEEDPGPEELPEQSEAGLDETSIEPVESEPVIEPEPEPEPEQEIELTEETGITDASGNIVTWSGGYVTYASDTDDNYVRYSF